MVYNFCCLVVQSLSHVQLFAAPWTAAHQAPLSFTISWSLLIFRSIELVMISNHLILCRPFLLLPSIFPSFSIFSNESALQIRWPKYQSFSISSSSKYSGLISFRTDWFDILAKFPGIFLVSNLRQYPNVFQLNKHLSKTEQSSLFSQLLIILHFPFPHSLFEFIDLFVKNFKYCLNMH